MQLATLTVQNNRRADLLKQASSKAAELQRQQLESALASTNNTQLHLMRVLTAKPSARAQLSMYVLARRCNSDATPNLWHGDVSRRGPLLSEAPT